MHTPFFPGPFFGWAYWLVLTGLLAVAAYVDWRTMVVPKKLTLTALGLGLAFNLVRGTWMGWRGLEVWALGTGGPLVGAADGLAFAAVGMLLGFGLFFVMWLMGICGGGDVKLFAALGAWVGPNLAVFVLAGTIVVVLVLTLARLAWALPVGLLRGRLLPPPVLAQAQPVPPPGGKRPRKRLMTYSLPVALSTALVLLWVLRADLHLAAPHATNSPTGEVHAR
jgi:prepilin peptidase CpaA